MIIKILDSWGNYSSDARNQICLTWDNWNDWSYYTLFGIFYLDQNAERIDLGNIKIGHFGQVERERKLNVGDEFPELGSEFFSVGVDVEYYERLSELGSDLKKNILKALRDIAYDEKLFELVILEDVTKISLLRNTTETSITGQFRRIALGGSKLTSYSFKFLQNDERYENPLELSFAVIPDSLPPNNVHVVVGQNGIGKTFLINSMIDSIMKGGNSKFTHLGNEYDSELFANLVFVSFSAFDSYIHPIEQKDKTLQFPYAYIGLKNIKSGKYYNQPKSPELLAEEFVASITNCINSARMDIWKKLIMIIESDPIFKLLNLIEVVENSREKGTYDNLLSIFTNLSSGHKIILLTITKLVENVEEKSLVLFDEPESHLHPPLLSSFIRAVSTLLINRNGVAVIATHSPVILQEVPRSCVWKIRKIGTQAIAERLEIESFGENVGVLTQEIFGLEVTDSGFHKILLDLVQNANSYDEAILLLNKQLGLEAKAILKSLFYEKNSI